MVRARLLDQDIDSGRHGGERRQEGDVDVREDEDHARDAMELGSRSGFEIDPPQGGDHDEAEDPRRGRLEPPGLSAVPRATATIDSPRTMSVNRAKRAGRWITSTGMSVWGGG
jgi:hypothetical protein